MGAEGDSQESNEPKEDFLDIVIDIKMGKYKDFRRFIELHPSLEGLLRIQPNKHPKFPLSFAVYQGSNM